MLSVRDGRGLRDVSTIYLKNSRRHFFFPILCRSVVPVQWELQQFTEHIACHCSLIAAPQEKESVSACLLDSWTQTIDKAIMCSVYMVGYWQGCRLVIIAFGLILMFMSAADALRRQCSSLIAAPQEKESVSACLLDSWTQTIDKAITVTYSCIQLHTVAYSYIQLHTVTYSYIQLHTVTYSYIQLHTVTYTYTHTHIHTHTHTHIHTYIY